MTPLETKRPAQHKVPDSKAARASSSKQIACTKKNNPRSQSWQQVPRPKIPELTAEKRCFTKIPELTQEKPKRFLKQLPGPMIPQSVLESKSWLLKTGAPIQYSRIEFWNWCQLLKQSPGPKTPELIPDTRSWGHWKQVPKPEFSLEKSLRT